MTPQTRRRGAPAAAAAKPPGRRPLSRPFTAPSPPEPLPPPMAGPRPATSESRTARTARAARRPALATHTARAAPSGEDPGFRPTMFHSRAERRRPLPLPPRTPPPAARRSTGNPKPAARRGFRSAAGQQRHQEEVAQARESAEKLASEEATERLLAEERKMTALRRERASQLARVAAITARRKIVDLSTVWLQRAPPYGLGTLYDILASLDEGVSLLGGGWAGYRAERSVRADWMVVGRRGQPEGRKGNPTPQGQQLVGLGRGAYTPALMVKDKALVLRPDSPRAARGGYPQPGVELLLTHGELSNCVANLPQEAWAGIRAAAGKSAEERAPANGLADWLAYLPEPAADAAMGPLLLELQRHYYPIFKPDLQRLRQLGRKNAQRELLASFPGTPSQHEYAVVMQQAFRCRRARRDLAARLAAKVATELLLAEVHVKEEEVKHHAFKGGYAQQLAYDMLLQHAAEVVQGHFW